ncbi:molybdopterin molybdenumtransferase [Virgibacillus phasianinus]|uniref:Molybdopterin molybdenumtransferase n=1 Tax=Virgibacillus phasianinus TaxID=2017483 RepID=A0A220U685_9BACI|nr:gephyrin-like molybdotransferase Glp [Virgibacillus phasianinus]ASK63668.1 molybdopterin molybdenumtransferase [Virgibacillus phasianinus]
MVEKRKPMPVDQAIAKVMEFRKAGGTEVVSIDRCDGRRLAEPLYTTNPVPSFNKSPYDGFALRSCDTEQASRNNPVEFEIVEHVGAGHVPEKKLEEYQATRIMTGAQIPDGADCVAMFEICSEIKRNGKDFISLKRTMESGQNVVKKASEIGEGKELVRKGSLINPGVKALLATFGYQTVHVMKKPIVGIFATGSELLDVDAELEPGKIRNSNAYMIMSQIKRAGGDPHYFGKLDDELESSFQAIAESIDKVDFLITTGGVSVGDFDLMPAIYEKLHATVLFNKVAMRPGSVTTVTALQDKLLFGLSGNPSACYVGFELFVRPILQTFLMNDTPLLKRSKAILTDDFPKPNPFTRFVRGILSIEDGQVRVSPAGIDKSNVVTSLAFTNGLMVLPGGTRGYNKGAIVDVLWLDQMEGQTTF